MSDVPQDCFAEEDDLTDAERETQRWAAAVRMWGEPDDDSLSEPFPASPMGEPGNERESLLADALLKLAEQYEKRARSLYIDHEKDLPSEVAFFLDDISVLTDDARREARRG